MPATIRERDFTQARQINHCRITGPTSYATNGEAVTPKTFGLTRLDVLIIGGPATDGSQAIRHVVWDRANSKLIWFTESTGTLAQVANATNLSTFSVDVIAVGA